ncbi:hypothetical protein SMA90_34295, partial [Escherichia coli]
SKRGGSLAAYSESTIALPALTVLEKTSLVATSGGEISLPSVATYDSIDGAFRWESTGPGSVIDLSGLQYLEGQTYRDHSSVKAVS